MTAPRPEKVAAGDRVDVALTVNGTPVTVRVSTREHLADVLRTHLGLTGTHLGCEHGVCGMCTVLVDGDAARACLLFAVQCDGAEIVTVEGLGAPERPHPLQRAFSAHHGLQCGFCTPGMLMSSYDLLAHDPSAADLPAAMSGVICRCTGYRGILAAISDVADTFPAGVPAPGNCGRRTLVGRAGRSLPVGTADAAPAAAPTREVRVPAGVPAATVDVTSALDAPLADVWAVLSDVERLVACLPGARLLEVLGEDRYRGRATVALGPVKLGFDGLAQVVERDAEHHRMHLVAQGADAGGSATQADIRLVASTGPDGATVLRAEAALHLSGRIAQFGRALAGDVSRRMFEQFAAAVAESAKTGTAPALTGPNPLRIALAALLDTLKRVARLRR